MPESAVNPAFKERLTPRLGAVLALLAVAVPLLLTQQIPSTLVQDLGSTPVPNITGLGQSEQGENGAFRWSTGPVEMRLQPLGYPLYTVLRVQGVRPEGEPEAEMAISSGGRELGTFTVSRAPGEVEVRLPIAQLAAINPTLEITTTLFQPPGDRRTLGVVFYSLEQRSGPGPGLPSLWPAMWLMLSGLLSFGVGWLFTRKSWYGLVAALVLGLSVGVLNAVTRPWLVFYSLYFVVPPLIFLLGYRWIREMGDGPSLRPWRANVGLRTTITDRPERVAIAVVGGAVLLLVWHLIAPLVPTSSSPTDNLTWGVAFYGAIPWPLQLLGIAAVSGALLWAWLSPVTDTEQEPPPEEDDRGSLAGWVRDRWTWLLAGTSLVLFSLMPVQYSEGDSEEFDRKIPIGAIWRERELLDFYFKSKLWLLLRGWLPKPSQVYAVVASISGAVYVAGAWLLGRTLGRSRQDVWIVTLALLSIGNILLFFGYVESYNLVQIASLFVIWSCWQYTRGRLPFGTVALFATIAPLLHGSALWWGPMVVGALLLRARQLPPGTRLHVATYDLLQGMGVGLAVVTLMASVMIIDGYDYERLQTGLGEMGGLDGRTMLPLFEAASPYERYTFLSPPHLGAVLQEQLLTAPMALLTIVLVCAFCWPGVKRLSGRVPSFAVLLIGAASIFFYSISWNPDLGPRDDWDLLSLPAIPLTLVAIYLLIQLPKSRWQRLALAAYLGVSALHTATWVLIHVAGIRY